MTKNPFSYVSSSWSLIHLNYVPSLFYLTHLNQYKEVSNSTLILFRTVASLKRNLACATSSLRWKGEICSKEISTKGQVNITIINNFKTKEEKNIISSTSEDSWQAIFDFGCLHSLPVEPWILSRIIVIIGYLI